MTKLCATGILFVVLLIPRTAVSDPVQWASGVGGNDHFYEVVSDVDISWSAARTAANGSTYRGMTGHLATITSAAENAFLRNLVSAEFTGAELGPWLGGFQLTQPSGQANPTRNWQWVTGETWAFTNWRPLDPSIYPYQEPNDIDNVENNDENVAHFHSPGIAPWAWNDAPDALTGVPGYLLEFAPSDAAPVPEPGTLLLTAIAFSVIGGRVRRRRTSAAASGDAE